MAKTDRLAPNERQREGRERQLYEWTWRQALLTSLFSWASYLTSLCLSFPSCRITTVVLNTYYYCNDEWVNFHKVLQTVSDQCLIPCDCCYLYSPNGSPGSSVGKESAGSAGDPGSIPGSRSSAGEGIGYPLQRSWVFLVAQLVKNPPAMQEAWVQPLGWEDPLEKGMATHSSVLAWRIPWTV